MLLWKIVSASFDAIKMRLSTRLEKKVFKTWFKLQERYSYHMNHN